MDHGKTALIRALTGVDTDRLKEEKERGITIELGFAALDLPNGLRLGIIDVPGHEKFVKNMVAGAGGIDFVVLVIAADEGVMPQTREHLEICSLLGIRHGVVALTKMDLVDPDWLSLVQEDIREFLRGTFLDGAPVVPVSAVKGQGLGELVGALEKAAGEVVEEPDPGFFRLPIDRVFTIKGFGTVVTGTAVSGSISVDNDIEILPSNIKSKVRGLHSHGKPIRTAYAGQRVAINLQGIDKDELQRGDTVVVPEKLVPTRKLDAKVELLPNAPVLKSKSLVHFHLGTSETTARIILFGTNELKAGENCYGQFRLQAPVIAMSGDRYIIRRFSPLDTIGGGAVLDPLSHRRSPKEGTEDLSIFETGTLQEKIAVKVKRAGIYGMKITLIEGWVKAEIPSIKDSVRALKETGSLLQFEDVLIHKAAFDSFRENVVGLLTGFHRKNPLKPGMLKEEIRAHINIDPRLFGNFIASLKEIVLEKELVRLATFKVALSEVDETTKTKILELLDKSGFQPQSKEELSQALKIDQKRFSDILKLMTKEGRLVRISDSIYMSSSVYKQMIDKLKDFYSRKPEMTVAEFRDVLNTTRKYALPFLEYLDANNVTLRVGDIRKLLLK